MKLPRQEAIRVLGEVLGQHKHLDQAILSVLKDKELESPAYGWLLDVTSGALRYKGRIDLMIDSLARKKPTGWLRRALLLAAYQILDHDKVHPGKVVSEYVSLIKDVEGPQPAGFANAILRKIGSKGPWKADAHPAAWFSLPGWMWKALLEERDAEWAKAFAKASLERPQVWIRSLDPSWQSEGCKPGPIPHSFVLEKGVRPDRLDGFGEGKFFVQDISSQRLIHEASQFLSPLLSKSSARVLDLCASPGGKTMGLAAEGFQVDATEFNRSRVHLLELNRKRTGLSFEILPYAEVIETQNLYDAVWVDAPCSSSGVIRRHPEIKWIHREKEIKTLHHTQAELIQLAMNRLVKPGGWVIYSVCSIFKKEGIEAIERAGFKDQIESQFLYSPHEEPYGDGFQGFFLRNKSPR